MQFILKQLNGLANLKVIPADWIKSLVENFAPVDESKNSENLKANGYESTNILINLGGFLPILAISLVGVIVLAIIGCIIKKFKVLRNPKVRKLVTKI
jgi:hypothetical protein